VAGRREPGGEQRRHSQPARPGRLEARPDEESIRPEAHRRRVIAAFERCSKNSPFMPVADPAAPPLPRTERHIQYLGHSVIRRSCGGLTQVLGIPVFGEQG
jgi:hypothetical protein